MFCDEHDSEKINVDNEFVCLKCLKENSDISLFRHKTLSNLTKIKYVYFFTIFSLCYSFTSFIFDFLFFSFSFINSSFTSGTENIIFLIKVITSIFLAFYFDNSIINKIYRNAL